MAKSVRHELENVGSFLESGPGKPGGTGAYGGGAKSKETIVVEGDVAVESHFRRIFFPVWQRLIKTAAPVFATVLGMETTLHRQLKDYYAGPDSRIEVPLGRYRIDIVDGDRLIEVQHSGLSSIRDKVQDLLTKKHQVEVIKPLIARKRLVNLDGKDGNELKSRWSPKRCTRIDMFHELLYFTRVFPHSGLTLRMPLIEIQESRFPHKRRNRRRGQFKIQDQSLLNVVGEDVYETRADLRSLLPKDLPKVFGTKELSEMMEVDRWVAQRIAYCLRKTKTVKEVGKKGNSLQYQFVPSAIKKTPTKKPLTKKPSTKKSKTASKSKSVKSVSAANVRGKVRRKKRKRQAA